MTVKKAVSDARRICLGQKGEVFDFLLVQIMVRLTTLTPCLFLLTDQVRYLTVLCVPLFFLLIPFVREKSAGNMQGALSGGRLFSRDMLSLQGYGGIVLRGLLRGFLLLLWASPFVATTLWGYRVIFGTTVVGQTDVFSVILALTNLGGGDMILGTGYAVLIYLATLLPFCFGLAFHSGARHARALGDRKLVKGHRGGILKAWLRGLLPMLPFLAVTGGALGRYLYRVLDALNNMSGSGLSIPSSRPTILIVLAAFVLLLLPVMTYRSLISAAYMHGVWEEREKKEETEA